MTLDKTMLDPALLCTGVGTLTQEVPGIVVTKYWYSWTEPTEKGVFIMPIWSWNIPTAELVGLWTFASAPDGLRTRSVIVASMGFPSEPIASYVRSRVTPPVVGLFCS